MTLVQLGSVTINMDQVTRFIDLSGKNSAGQMVPGAIRLFFDGGDSMEVFQGADVLRNWLGINAQVLNITTVNV